MIKKHPKKYIPPEERQNIIDDRRLIYMLHSSLCDYIDEYIYLSGTLTIPNTGTAAKPNKKKCIIFKNCAAFTHCISKINNKQIDDAKDIDVVIPIYNLIEYSDNQFKTLGSLCQYYIDGPFFGW